MNTDKHLILVKGEDKTEAISQCTYEDGKWHITFAGGKTYPYNYLHVQWLKNPISLDSATTIVYHNSLPVSGVDKILDFGDYIRICFVSGYKKVYPKQEIKLEQSCLNKSAAANCFDYLKQLADKVGVTGEEDRSFLSKQYDKITCFSPGSVLVQYLSPTTLSYTQTGQMPIFPFGFNLSQKEATEKALTEQLSVIEGPPGTGKTQTILNIIANAIIDGKTVAVVSNNNAATANVLENLQKYGVDFIAAYLGNNQNKETLFAQQTQTYPDMTTWVLDTADYQEIKRTLEKNGKQLVEMLEVKNNVARLKQDLTAISLEKEYFDTYYNESYNQNNEEIAPYRSFYRHNSETIMALWLDYQQMAEEGNWMMLSAALR